MQAGFRKSSDQGGIHTRLKNTQENAQIGFKLDYIIEALSLKIHTNCNTINKTQKCLQDKRKQTLIIKEKSTWLFGFIYFANIKSYVIIINSTTTRFIITLTICWYYKFYLTSGMHLYNRNSECLLISLSFYVWLLKKIEQLSDISADLFITFEYSIQGLK